MNIPTPTDIQHRAVDLGINMQEVCRRAKLSPSTFSEWKSGKKNISVRTLQRLLDATEPKAAE
jgi:transcriptional regulator with XRE-family HTH domain